MQHTAALIGDVVGGTAVLVGLSAIVWHLNELAFWVGLAAFIGGYIAIIIGGAVNADKDAKETDNKHQVSKDASVSEPADAASRDNESHMPPATP